MRVRGQKREYGYMCKCVGNVQEKSWWGLGITRKGLMYCIHKAQKLNICNTVCNQNSIVSTSVIHALTTSCRL